MTMTSFSIKWNAPETSGSSDLLDYIIEIREENTDVWKKVATTEKHITTCPISNMKYDQKYFVRVSARNKDGAISDPLNYEDVVTVGQRIRKWTGCCSLVLHLTNLFSYEYTRGRSRHKIIGRGVTVLKGVTVRKLLSLYNTS